MDKDRCLILPLASEKSISASHCARVLFENGVDAVKSIKINGTSHSCFLLTISRCSNLFPQPLSLLSNLIIIVTAQDGLKRVTTGPMVIIKGSQVERVVTE